MEAKIIKVKSSSDVTKLSSSITAAVLKRTKDEQVEIRAVGAGAVNQAIKAVIKANSALHPHGVSVLLRPMFFGFDDPNSGKELSGIGFILVVSS